LTENTSQPIKTRRIVICGNVELEGYHILRGTALGACVPRGRCITGGAYTTDWLTRSILRQTVAVIRAPYTDRHARTHSERCRRVRKGQITRHIHTCTWHTHTWDTRVCTRMQQKTCTKSESESLFRADNYWSILSSHV